MALGRQSTNLEDKIIIDRSKADLIKEEEQFIHGLFKVWIVLENSDNRGNFNKQQITLFGGEKNLQDAKEYVLALCEPEYAETIDGNMFGVLNNPQLVQNLIITNKVAVKPGLNGQVVISGRSLNVVLAKATIENEEIKYQESILNGIRKDSGSSENVDDDDDDNNNTDSDDDDPYAHMDDTVKKVPKESKIYALDNSESEVKKESGKTNGIKEGNSRATFANLNHENILKHYEVNSKNEESGRRIEGEKAKPVRGTFANLDPSSIMKDFDVKPKKNVKLLEAHQSRDDSRGPRTQIRHKSVNSCRKTDNTIRPITSNSDDLRPIFIDGSNVAREHGKVHGNTYSCVGMQQVVDYFLQRGHKTVEVFVPRFRRGNSDKLVPTTNPEILDKLDAKGILKYTPSASYDDRFVIEAAIHHDGVIVSNDQYRDLIRENPAWANEVPKRLLQYVFSGNLFIPAADPFGRRGPKLDDFLTFSSGQKVPVTFNNVRNVSAANRANRGPTRDVNSNTVQRDIMTTTTLYTKLQGSFQGHESKIAKLLNQYPNETSYEFFEKQIRTENRSKDDKGKKQKKKDDDSKDKRKSNLSRAELFSKLDRAFSGYQQEILELLEKYPNQNDYGFFANMIRKSGEKSNASNNGQMKEQNKNKPKNDQLPNRSTDITTALFKRLNKVFPNQQPKILQLLEQFSNQKDFNFFASMLTNQSSSINNENVTQTRPEENRSKPTTVKNDKKNHTNLVNDTENRSIADNFQVTPKNRDASKDERQKRSSELTSVLLSQLNKIFPKQQSKILQLFEQYQYETKFEFFFNILKNSQT